MKKKNIPDTVDRLLANRGVLDTLEYFEHEDLKGYRSVLVGKEEL